MSRRKYYKYNPETLIYEIKEESQWKRVGRIVLAVAIAAALVWSYHWIYTSVFGWELPKTAILRKSQLRLNSKLDVLNRQLDFYDITLTGIEERDDRVYRSIFGLGNVDEVQMPERENVGGRADSLAERAVLRSKSLDEVNDLAKTAGDMASHVPAVPPISPAKGSYRLSSPFGGRTDPIYGGGEFHQGQDFACDRGNPVYATGGGRVEKVDYKFNGYGNEVVINHGFGYRTRYAHLNTIKVTEGMELERGDIIGTVGSSGKSTGPHLHYEVMYRDRRLNPMLFMDMTMSVPEFKAMVEKRQVESKYTDDRMPTTMEILRRRDR